MDRIRGRGSQIFTFRNPFDRLWYISQGRRPVDLCPGEGDFFSSRGKPRSGGVSKSGRTLWLSRGPGQEGGCIGAHFFSSLGWSGRQLGSGHGKIQVRIPGWSPVDKVSGHSCSKRSRKESGYSWLCVLPVGSRCDKAGAWKGRDAAGSIQSYFWLSQGNRGVEVSAGSSLAEQVHFFGSQDGIYHHKKKGG